jgi:hypothetical protein
MTSMIPEELDVSHSPSACCSPYGPSKAAEKYGLAAANIFLCACSTVPSWHRNLMSLNFSENRSALQVSVIALDTVTLESVVLYPTVSFCGSTRSTSITSFITFRLQLMLFSFARVQTCLFKYAAIPHDVKTAVVIIGQSHRGESFKQRIMLYVATDLSAPLSMSAFKIFMALFRTSALSRAVQKHWTAATWRGDTGPFEWLLCSLTKITVPSQQLSTSFRVSKRPQLAKVGILIMTGDRSTSGSWSLSR